jgi:hypothetical protein
MPGKRLEIDLPTKFVVGAVAQIAGQKTGKRGIIEVVAELGFSFAAARDRRYRPV